MAKETTIKGYSANISPGSPATINVVTTYYDSMLIEFGTSAGTVTLTVSDIPYGSIPDITGAFSGDDDLCGKTASTSSQTALGARVAGTEYQLTFTVASGSATINVNVIGNLGS